MDHYVDIVGAGLGVWWPHREIVIEVVHEISNHVVIFENPFKSISKTVKEVWGGAQAKG